MTDLEFACHERDAAIALIAEKNVELASQFVLLDDARRLLARCPHVCNAIFVGQDSVGYGVQARALAKRIKGRTT